MEREIDKKYQLNTKKQSGLMKLLCAYKSETDEIKKAAIKKKLTDEMSIYVYTYAIKHPLIRAENASLLLLSAVKLFDKCIESYNIDGAVDFAYYFKKVIAMMGKAFFNGEKKGWVESGVSFSFLIPDALVRQEENNITEEALSGYKTLNSYEIKDEKKRKVQDLLKKRCVQDYILSTSLLLDEDTISSIVNNLPSEDRLDFINKYLKLKHITEEKRSTLYGERSMKYLLRKRSAELKDEKESSMSHERYTAIVKRNQKRNMLSYKPSYADMKDVLLKSRGNLASSISQGKYAIIEYKKCKKEERHEIYTSEFKPSQAL